MRALLLVLSLSLANLGAAPPTTLCVARGEGSHLLVGGHVGHGSHETEHADHDHSPSAHGYWCGEVPSSACDHDEDCVDLLLLVTGEPQRIAGGKLLAPAPFLTRPGLELLFAPLPSFPLLQHATRAGAAAPPLDVSTCSLS